jgi:peroxiredoxin
MSEVSLMTRRTVITAILIAIFGVTSRMAFANPEGKIVKVFTEVNPNQHSAEVLAALVELQK